MNLKAFIYCNARSSGAKRKRPWNFFILLLLASVFSTVAAASGNAEEETGTSAVPSSETFQQNGIAGYVYDETGEPVPGASVAVKGTQTGTVTDGQGRFVLSVAAGTELEISFIGYVTQTVRAAAGMRVALQEDTKQIEEVVVIGYGTVRKSDLTGSLVSISSEKFKNLPQGGVTQILQGKAAGVNITSTRGAGNTNIRIRGITSLNKSSEPLWVVDGVIGGSVGNFYDIQSIEVLKDASSTAIYGSQGANGVILVTTRRGQEGNAKVTFDARYNWATMRKIPDLLSPYEYAKAYNDIVGGGSISDEDMAAYKAGTKGIDWIDLMTQTGFSQNYNLNISGGSKLTKYTLTAWGGDSRGQLITTTSRNYNFKATLDTEITPWFTVSSYVTGSTGNSHNGSGQNQFTDIIEFSPCMELQAPDGTYNLDPYGALGNSPYGELHARYWDDESHSFTGFADLRFRIMDGLTLSLQGLYSRNQSINRSFSSIKRYPNSPNEAYNRSDQNYRWRNINNLTYQKEFGDHRLTATGILETTKYEWSRLEGRGRDLSLEQVSYWNLASASTKDASNAYSGDQMVSTLGRLIYSYRGKYVFTGTFRADAPSQFKNDYKWGYFPSGGLAWNIAEESFINKDIFQQLKFRATMGSTGNHGVGPYATLAALTQDNAVYGLNEQFPGFWLNKFVNPDIHWEKTVQYDLGADISVLDQRLNLTVDWFRKNTTDLLFEKNLPLYNGGGKIWTNQGAVDNTGWEFTFNGYPLRRQDMIWESTLTATYTKNTIKDLAGETRIIPDATRGGLLGGGLFAMEPGMPVGSFYLFDWVGFDDNGANLYRKADGSTTINPNDNDRIVTGNPTPEWIFGWNNQFNYKNWDLNLFFRATGKYNRLNLSRYVESCKVGASRFISSREAYYLSWDRVADKSHAEFPSLSNPDNKYYGASTQWLENAAFLRLQNLTLGYKIPKSSTGIADIHLSISADNLFVLSKYKGMDPETVSEINETYRDTTFGLDNGSFPVPRSYTFILRFDF
ncbi:MAG: TonB-dependent receptor [Tannerella sp.]|jgi:TonB-linked SusC/RagA family outer membrane protein|nr:TonB-dependent receptor [Tannerella sp.]